MEMGYSKYRNPYHNLIHAADVLQTTYQIIYSCGLMVMRNINDKKTLDKFDDREWG